MGHPVIKVENLCKEYRLGTIGNGTLSRDIQTLAARLLGRPDPNSPLHSSAARGSGALFSALDDVSFEVGEGEVLGLIGRNGAGKSTLLKIISRVTAPTRGEVKIRGRIASLLEVGTGFHPELSGRENVFLNGAILGMTKREISAKFDQIVDFAEVEKFIDTPVKRYSSGMHVRLAFAVAAHLEPEILVIDEVLAVGDAQFQKKCLGKMGEVGKSGRTVLFVSHNMEAVSSLCSRALVLHEGKMTFEGEVDAAISSYREKVRAAGISVDNCFSRGGSGGVRISGVTVVSGGDAKVTIGEPLSILVDLQVQRQYRGKSLDIGIGIDTASGQRLFTNVSSWEQCDLVPASEFVTVTCKIDSMLLVPGEYLVGVSVAYLSDTLDCAIQCAELDVYDRPGIYASRGRDHGAIYMPCNFSIDHKAAHSQSGLATEDRQDEA